MISIFIREQQRYTQKQIFKLLKRKETESANIIAKLKECGLLRCVRNTSAQFDLSDLEEKDVALSEIQIGDSETLYIFTFVGIIIFAGYVLKCYPKYLPNNIHPTSELKQILKVIEKFSNKEQRIQIFDESNQSHSFNRLAIMMFLMNDYFENGLYSNTVDIIEENGTGEILWEKTINETFTLICHNKTYYPNLLTKRRTSDEFDYFRRLHECILTSISKDLKRADLLTLFDITEIDLSQEELLDFGDKDYILYRIERELNSQFITRKQIVLKTIYSYIEFSGHQFNNEYLSLYGTNSFNLVWENVCSCILDNQLEKPLSSLNLPVPFQINDPSAALRLIDLIERPKWSIVDTEAEDTLIPDLITISEGKFIIFDAKYYTPVFEPGKPPRSQPGIESVTKQYLYQLAYQNFINDHGFTQDSIKNCFLMPTAHNEVINMGTVKMNIFSNLGLQDIEIRYIPATIAYEHYLSGKTMDLSTLNL